MEKISVATLNIGAASKQRAQRILDEWIIPSSYDIFVFTETSEGEGTSLIASAFVDVGWAIAHFPVQDDRGVLLASRIPFKCINKVYQADPARGRTVVVQLNTHPCVEIVGMYVPNRGNDSQKTERKWSYLKYWLSHLSRSPLAGSRILLGDLNVVPGTQHPRFLPQQQFEYEWLERLLSSCDLYDIAVKHNQAGHENTWVAHTGEGYTYDHILISKALQNRVCGFSYDHTTRRRDGITDHSALSVVIELDTVSHLQAFRVGTPRQAGLFSA
jgi:exonuclease III